MTNKDVADRKHRRIERTPEDLERLRAIRAEVQLERPSLDQLLAKGNHDGPVSLGIYQNLVTALSCLKTARAREGLSLADVSERSGIDRGAISRLENGHNMNPTIDTLDRYAAAVGKRFAFMIEEVPAS